MRARVGERDWQPVAADPNRLREAGRTGQPTIGCALALGSPTATELVASVGLDWIIIESDHYGTDSADVQALLMASARTGTVPIVRVPPRDLNAIEKALDVGAMGVVVPMVGSAEEAARVVAATRYPPRGTRSFGPMRGSSYYFDARRYLDEIAPSLLVWLILETRGAVDDLEHLAEAGVNGIFVGPCDLSLAYGLDPITDNEEIEEVGRRAIEIGRRTGLAVGINVATPDGLRERRAQGYTLIDVGPEYQYIAAGLQAQLHAFAEAEPRSRVTTLAETLREQARRQPDTPFLTFESASGDVAAWSYAELDRRVDGLAAGLERAGLRTGDRFLVVLHNHPVSIALVLAASRTGTVAVAVDPALRARELAVCVDVARPRLIVADAGGEVEALGLPVWAMAEPSAADWLGEPPRVNGAATTPSPDDVIELLFTSGTTSRPKAVMWTNAAVLHGARTLARAAALRRGRRRARPAQPLARGRTGAPALADADARRPRRAARALQRAQLLRPGARARRDDLRALRRLAADAPAARQPDGPLPLRHVTFAQSLTRAEYTDWERRIGVPLQHLWGMTETVGLPIMSPLDGDRRLEAMGRAVPGYRVDVRGGQAADDGRVEGELVVAARPGDDVTLGYFGDPDGDGVAPARRRASGPATSSSATPTASCTSWAAMATSSGAPG